MTLLTTARLIIRNWEDGDRDLFRHINADDQVMAFFPFRRDRAASDALLDRLRGGIAERGYGFAAVVAKETGQCVGFVGLNEVAGLPLLPSGTVEIGWRLAPEFWGMGYAAEAARAWLDFAFATLGLEEVVSFAVWNNARSIAVMKRIGMRADPGRDFDHPFVPDSHPHLKRHVLYCLTRHEWRR